MAARHNILIGLAFGCIAASGFINNYLPQLEFIAIAMIAGAGALGIAAFLLNRSKAMRATAPCRHQQNDLNEQIKTPEWTPLADVPQHIRGDLEPNLADYNDTQMELFNEVGHIQPTTYRWRPRNLHMKSSIVPDFDSWQMLNEHVTPYVIAVKAYHGKATAHKYLSDHETSIAKSAEASGSRETKPKADMTVIMRDTRESRDVGYLWDWERKEQHGNQVLGAAQRLDA